MLGFVLKMFVGLLSNFSTRIFGKSLVSDPEEYVTFLALKNWLFEATPTLINIDI